MGSIVSEDGVLLPGDSQLNMHGQALVELVLWEGNVTAEDSWCVGDWLQDNHTGDNIDTCSHNNVVDDNISSSETRHSILGISGTDGGSLGVNSGNVCHPFSFNIFSSLSSDENIRLAHVCQSEVNTGAEFWCSDSGGRSLGKLSTSVLELDVALALDLSVLSNSDVVDIEVVHTREQQSLVEADFESCSSDTAGPHIDDLFESSSVDRQFDSWYTSHGLHKVHSNTSANGFLVVDDNSSVLEFVGPQ
jgi:hypothetical protein